jgi:RNA polymerase sigma factor (sigma-70 family)
MLSILLFNKRTDDVEFHQWIYEMFYKRVYQTAYYITKDVHLAQDVTQETFIKALRNIHRLTDKEKVGAWLFTIATRTAIDVLRKQNKYSITLDDAFIEGEAYHSQAASTVESEVEKMLEKEELWCHIEKLSHDYRAVIVLKYIHDFKDEEIAETLDCNVGTIKSRLHRAKKKLSSLMEENWEERAYE